MAVERNEVLAVGSIMVDLLCRVPRLPLSGEGIVVEDERAMLGGCAFNSANAVRQLGVPCRLFAPVGEGVFAGFVERGLKERGIEAFHVAAGPDGIAHDNGGCVCFVEPGGQRTMVTLPGVDRHFDAAWFERLDPARYSCGFASGYEIEGEGGDAIIGFFEAHPEIAFYYAPGPRIESIGKAKTARINGLHPVWHLNDQEAIAFTDCASVEEAGPVLAQACGNAVVITAGAQGAHLFEGGRHVVVPTQPAKIVDTVGAGDAHLGSLVAARSAGRPWEEALALANRIAGAVCQVEGGVLDDAAFAVLGVRL